MVNAFKARSPRGSMRRDRRARPAAPVEEPGAWTVDLGGVVGADRCTCSADRARRWARAAAGARAGAGWRRIGEPTGPYSRTPGGQASNRDRQARRRAANRGSSAARNGHDLDAEIRRPRQRRCRRAPRWSRRATRRSHPMNPQPSPPIPIRLPAAHCAAHAAFGCSRAVFARANGLRHGAQALDGRRALQALARGERQSRAERLS